MCAITNMEQLRTRLSLTESENSFQKDKRHLPVLISEYYFSLINPDDPDDPIRRQVVPTACEQDEKSWSRIDPLAEVDHSVTPRLVHRYRGRVAFLTTDICATYCRHCFRRRFTGTFKGPATDEEIEQAALYCKAHPEVKEILLTGGDMFTLSNREIENLIAAFRAQRPDLVIRLCSRMPVTLPSRIDENLVSIFDKFKTAPFYLFTQFNHPKELTENAKRAVALFVDHGIPAMNQSVLLKGVNDDADVLEELCTSLVSARIKPYYLFQGDFVSGTDHLRVPIEKGLYIEKELRRRLSGLAMPNYVSDLPEGGGKVPLSESYIDNKEGSWWTLHTLDGEKRYYQDPIL